MAGGWCWAETLGDCKQGKSGEHLVSESIFVGPAITVTGAPWRATGAPKTIGLASAVANILCGVHNSRLSGTDSAAGDAMKALRGFIGTQESRRRLTPRAWLIVVYRISGLLLERWFLKTLINLTVVRDKGLLWNASQPFNRPPAHLVRAAFGLERLTFPAGLYFDGQVQKKITSDREGLESIHVLDAENQVVGARFLLRGFPFLLWLTTEFSPGAGLGVDLGHAMHHPRIVKGNIGERPSHELHFDGW